MTTLHLPPALTEGSRVALVTPARFASPELIDAASNLLTSWGLDPVVPTQTTLRDHQFGGTDAQRAEALNAAFRDPDISAVWALRGGYGCTRILPLLDGSALQANPTWITGFPTSPPCKAGPPAWASRLCTRPWPRRFRRPTPQTWRRSGRSGAQGSLLRTKARRVVGGNLSVLFAMLGTPSMPPLKGRWLLLEDLDEYLYHLDRMLVALGQAGVFDEVEGVLLGSFTDLKDNTKAFGQAVDNPFGRTVRDMVEEHVVARGCAVEWEVPSGHGPRNAPWVLG